MDRAERDVRQALDALVERCRQDDLDREAIVGARSWLSAAVRELRRATTWRTRARQCEAMRQRA